MRARVEAVLENGLLLVSRPGCEAVCHLACRPAARVAELHLPMTFPALACGCEVESMTPSALTFGVGGRPPVQPDSPAPVYALFAALWSACNEPAVA